MKTGLLVSFATVFAVGAFAQGTVNFCNINSAAGLNAPVFFNDGSTRLSSGYTAELMAGTRVDQLYSVAATGFLSGAGAGYFQGGVVSIPTVRGGDTAFLQVRVFATAEGSFAQAEFDASAHLWENVFGFSQVFSVVTGNPAASPPGIPAALTGLTSFGLNILIPEPSSLALVALGSASLLLMRRR